MNRIAVRIKEARLQAKLTEKQLARKCGLAESYMIQIESGRKVINEKTAETILEKLGERLEFVYDEVQNQERAGVEKDKKTVPRPKQEFYQVEPTEQWADALANLIKKFPIYHMNGTKVVGYKDLPVLGKKVEGYHWEKIMFVQAHNNDMECFRILKNDVLTISLTHEIANQSLYLIEMDQEKMIRQLRKENNGQVSVSKGIKGEAPLHVSLSKIKVIGKCVKVEFSLAP